MTTTRDASGAEARLRAENAALRSVNDALRRELDTARAGARAVPALLAENAKLRRELDAALARADPREWVDRRASAKGTRAANARQVSGRRRLIDPVTCDRDYTADEVEFMMAMQDYKHASGRLFPTWSEALGVVKALGYEKPGPGAVKEGGGS